MRPPTRLSPDELYDKVVAAGIETDHHHGDLYVPVTAETAQLIASYRFRTSVTRFRSEIAPHRDWFSVPFAYTPYFTERHRAIDPNAPSQ